MNLIIRITDLSKLIRPSAMFTAWWIATSVSHGHGAYHDVLIQIDAKLEANPDDAALWFQRAELHLSHDEWMQAIADLQKVEKLAPDQFPTKWAKGRAFETGGKPEIARTLLDGFISNNPDHAGALASRGRVLKKLGLTAAAVTDFRAVSAKSPDADPLLTLEIATAMADSGAAEEAARVLAAAIKRCGEDPALLLKSLEIELTVQHWDTALQRADSLQKSAPRPEPCMAKRAQILAQAGRNAESRSSWIALRDHLNALPNLERGTPQNLQLLHESLTALGEDAPKPVVAPPAS